MTDNSGSDSWNRCTPDQDDAAPGDCPVLCPVGALHRKMRAVTNMRSCIVPFLAVAAIALFIGSTSACAPRTRAEGSAASVKVQAGASGQASDGESEGNHTVIFDSMLVEALGYDSASDFIDDGKGTLDKDNVKTGYILAEAASDGSAHVTMSGLQLEHRKLLIQHKIDEAKRPYGDSRLSVASDLKTIDVRPTPDEAFEVKLDSIMFDAYCAAVYCMEMQVLNHPGDASCDVLIRVYDHDSGRLIVQGNMRDGGVSYTEEDWGMDKPGD